MGLASITNNILTDTGITPSGVISGTLASGQVAYGSAANTIAGSNNLFWNNTTNRLGINTPTPTSALQVVGTIRATSIGSPLFFSEGSDDLLLGTQGGTVGFTIKATTRNLMLYSGGLPADGGQRLQVYGDTLLRGSGNTSATTALSVLNTDNSILFDVRNDARARIGLISLYPTIDKGNTVNTGGGGLFIGYASGATYVDIPSVTLGKPKSLALIPTAGSMIMVSMLGNFAPTSGNATFFNTVIEPTINQVGATGITRGLYVNPTLTAAADWRSVEWSNNSGWGLYGAGTAANFLGGSLRVDGVMSQGGGTSVGVNFYMQKSLSGSSYPSGIYMVGTITSTSTNGATMFISDATTQAASFTLPKLEHFKARQTTFGAGSTVTNQYGFFAEGTLTGATNNYGFYGNIPSGTGRWNLYMNGDAHNYLAGNVGIGSGGTNDLVKLYIVGSTTGTTIYNFAYAQPQINTSLSSGLFVFRSNVSGTGTASTTDSITHFIAQQSSLGSATATNQYGFRVDTSLTGATNNFGFYGDIPSGTGRWNLYMNGSAANYLNGSLLIGSATDDGINKLQVTGNAKITGAISVGSGPSDFAGTMRTTNSTVPATGSGLEFGYLTGTSTGVIVSYNRGTTAYTALTINASTLNLNTGSNGTVNFGTGNAVIPGKVRSGASSGTSAYINIGINNVSEAQLNLATSTFTPTSPSNGDLWFNGTDVKFRISGVTTNFITGALTSGYVPKATGTSSIANSLVYDNGTSVLVNTNTAIPTPTTGTYSHAFQVLANAAGGMIVSTTNTASGIGIVNSSSANKTWDISPFNNDLAINESGVGARMYFLSGGNITVGGITNSGNLLEVLGTFKTTGVNTLSNLGGVGSRMVVADANGVLSTQAIPGGTLSGSGVAGQVTYWSGASSLTGDNNFFWDAANGRLGIGTNTPAATRTIDILTNLNDSQLVNIRNNSTGTSAVAGFQAQNSTQTASLFLTSTGYPTNGVIAANTMTLYSANASNIAIAVNSTGYFSIGAGNVTPTEKLRMFNNGNILIQDGGVYSDGGQRLQVTGRAIANNAITQGTFPTFGGNRIGLFGAQSIDVPTTATFNVGTVNSSLTGAQYLTFNGNTTVGGDALLCGGTIINSVQFATTGTVTMNNSAAGGQRTMSVLQLQMQKAGTVAGTVTRGSTLYLFGVYPTTSTGGIVTFTEYAGLRIGNLTEWAGGSTPNNTVVLTNKWGIYQEGTSDPNYFAGSVGIGVATNDASAKLQVDSTAQGFLPPRMTNVQMNAIVSPAAGLIVYNTTDNKHYGYNGTTWNAFY